MSRAFGQKLLTEKIRDIWSSTFFFRKLPSSSSDKKCQQLYLLEGKCSNERRRNWANKGHVSIQSLHISRTTIYLTKEYQVANTKTDLAATLCQKKRKAKTIHFSSTSACFYWRISLKTDDWLWNHFTSLEAFWRLVFKMSYNKLI